MPHMAPAALIPLIIQSIQQILPLLQSLFQNDNYSNDYNNGKISLKEFTDKLNKDLQKLDSQIEAATKKDFPIDTNPINSAQEARALADQLRAIVAKIDSGELKELSSMRGNILTMATSLDKAAIEFDSEGKTTDPDGIFNRSNLFPAPGSSSLSYSFLNDSSLTVSPSDFSVNK